MAVSITISVNGNVTRQLPNIPWHAGMNAQQAMEQAYQTGTGYSFTLQYFGTGLGYEVISIDNIASQSSTDAYLFWEFSLNGTPAQEGIDEVSLNDGDQIGWNYTTYNQAAHAGSRHAAIKAKMSA